MRRCCGAAFSSTRQASAGLPSTALPWLAAAALSLSVGAVVLPTVVMLRANRSLTELARRWAGGSLVGRARTSGLAGLGGLADALNQMAASLQRREETSRLREAELVGQTERLATTARLAAGVAHELNNRWAASCSMGTSWSRARRRTIRATRT